MSRTGAVVTAIVVGLTFSSAARAALGGTEHSADADARALNAKARVVSLRGSRVHELSSSVRTVREYVTSDGVVYAITWHGITHPDLSQLLGAYYREYQDAVATGPAPMSRNLRRVQSRNIVIEKFGHMRDTRGRAYVPALLPNGIDPESLE